MNEKTGIFFGVGTHFFSINPKKETSNDPISYHHGGRNRKQLEKVLILTIYFS